MIWNYVRKEARKKAVQTVGYFRKHSVESRRKAQQES